MIKQNLLNFAAFAVIVFVLIYHFRNYILMFIWNVFYKNVSDEKLEKIIRRQYEAYDANRKAYDESGLVWLTDMAAHLCLIWKRKTAVLQEINQNLPEEIQRSIATRYREYMQILSYWQDALRELSYEANRRKYFKIQ